MSASDDSFGGSISKLMTYLNPFNWLKMAMPKTLRDTVNKYAFPLGVGTGLSMLAVSFIFNLIWLLKPLPYLHERVTAAGCDFVGKGIIANELWNNVFSARMLGWIVFGVQILFMIGYFAAESSTDGNGGGYKRTITVSSVVLCLAMLSATGMLTQFAFHNTAARAFDDTVGCTGSWKGSAGQSALAMIFIVAACGFYTFTFTFYPSGPSPKFNVTSVSSLSRMFVHYIAILFAVASFILAVFIAAKTSVSVDDNIKACMVGINVTSTAEAQSVKVWLDKKNDPAGKDIALALTIVTGLVMLFQIASMDVFRNFMKASDKAKQLLDDVKQIRFFRMGVNCIAVVLWARLVMQSSSPWLNNVLSSVGCIVNKDADQTISLLVWIGFICTLLFEALTNTVEIEAIATKTEKLGAPASRRFDVYERVA